SQGGLPIQNERRESGCIDQVDLGASPLDVGQGAMNRSLAGNLVFIEIGDRSAFVYTAKAGRCPSIVKHRRDQRCLPRVAVAYNANVAYLLRAIDLHRTGFL